MSKTIEVTKVEIKMGREIVKLTTKEARTLLRVLKTLFGDYASSLPISVQDSDTHWISQPSKTWCDSMTCTHFREDDGNAVAMLSVERSGE